MGGFPSLPALLSLWPPWTTEPQTLLRLCVEDAWVSPSLPPRPAPRASHNPTVSPSLGLSRSTLRKGRLKPREAGTPVQACTAVLAPEGTS